MISAFEHSLANLTERLAKLTGEAEKKVTRASKVRRVVRQIMHYVYSFKDEELHDMKKVIKGLKESEENLSKSNGDTYLTSLVGQELHNLSVSAGSLSAHDFTSDGTRVANPSYPSRWKSDENVLMLSNDNNISEMRPNATQRKKSSTWVRARNENRAPCCGNEGL